MIKITVTNKGGQFIKEIVFNKNNIDYVMCHAKNPMEPRNLSYSIVTTNGESISCTEEEYKQAKKELSKRR